MRRRALIVDDALFMRNYIKGILERIDFEVCGEASSAPEAVEKYKELKPDLVTMDIIMPQIENLDGVGAVKEIINVDPKANIIVISAVGEEPVVKEVLACGAKTFLVKPFKPDRLIDAVHSLF